MNLQTKISEDLKAAMKEKNAAKLAVLRVLKAEIQRNEQSTNGKVELTDGDVVKLIKKIVEGIKETTRSQEELDALEPYLPKQMSEQEIKMVLEIVKKSGATNVGDFMKYFKAYHEGQYDGKILSNLVKEIL